MSRQGPAVHLRAIHNNLHNTNNPISKLHTNTWHCPETQQFKNMDCFFDTFNKESQCLLAEGGQSNIYTFIKNEHCSESKLVIGKFYDVTRKNYTLQSAWSEYILVKEAGLLMYDDIYYNESEQIAIIVSEPLNYTLRHYVEIKNKHRDITEHECKRIILDIMSKLWTTHRSGFIHNDLTPDNIMYRNGDFRKSCADCNGWKIIDYGLIIKITDSANQQYSYKGTRGWTSPETVPESNENIYSFAKDIWALGLIIIYILCKKQPYTLTGYEQRVLCKKDRYQYKQYFYYNKLLRCRNSSNSNSRLKTFMKKQFKKNDKNSLDFKAGELYLNKYLRNLYECNKISYDLCNLLSNYMLKFDPNKRLNCSQIYKHKWFDDVRYL